MKVRFFEKKTQVTEFQYNKIQVLSHFFASSEVKANNKPQDNFCYFCSILAEIWKQ